MKIDENSAALLVKQLDELRAYSMQCARVYHDALRKEVEFIEVLSSRLTPTQAETIASRVEKITKILGGI